MTKTPSSTYEHDLRPVKFSRLTRRGILLGLSGAQLVVVGTGAVTLVFALYLGGGILLAYAAPLILICAALAWAGAGGRKLVEWLPIVVRWMWRATGGQLLYRRRIDKPRPAGTLALPGDSACLRQWLDPETGAVMVHDPHQATLTAIVAVSHPAFILLDPTEQERRVVSWGRVLATACRSGRIASLQIMERTLPDSGRGLAEWWSRHGSHDDSWTAATYDELISRAGPAGERHASTVSLSLDLKTAARAIRAAGGGNRGAAAVLRQEMSTMAAALRAADLAPAAWLEPGDLARHAAGGLRPRGRGARSNATASSAATWPQPARSPSPKPGPACAATPPTIACSGSASGRARWSSPASSPPSCCRREYGEPSPCSTRRCEPTRPHETSARRRPSTSPTRPSASASGRSRTPSRPRSTTTSCNKKPTSQPATGSSAPPASSSISAPDPDELERAVAAIEQAAIQASCETRRLWGQQAQAFSAAALPLCRAV